LHRQRCIPFQAIVHQHVGSPVFAYGLLDAQMRLACGLTPVTDPKIPFMIFDSKNAATAGNRLYWGPLVDPTDGTTPITRNINAGDILRLSANQLSVQAI